MLPHRAPVPLLLRDLPRVAPPAAPPLVPAQRRPEPPRTAPAPAPPRVRRRGRLVALLLPVLLVAGALVGASSASAADDGRVDAYFFGDSLMAGTGATPLRPVMARVAASRLQWSVDVDAWGGTGFTTTGRSPSYLHRLRMAGALPRRYDVVLLEGGTNDARVGSSPAAIRAAVREVVAEVQRRQPQAQIVLMGAYDPPGVVHLHRAVADDAVRDVADELGLPFFSPLSAGWHTGQDAGRFLHGDGLHPNAYGYGVMGDRLADALEQALAGTGLVDR
ncbi:MAG TPA: SGNH/GDSL hydrolase family protein [Mycobacteriales bacterium]|nr:SGNH/GDSL hydrolase family protein [Mycobacteriales bacterium]